MPPDDPFGRGGPTLDTFLRRQKPFLGQPCPYDKKCTYGSKCKYYHPDSGVQQQKSITGEIPIQRSNHDPLGINLYQNYTYKP